MASHGSDGRPDPAEVWDSFCDSLKSAGDVLRRPSTPKDDLTRAEGLRYLARMVRVALESRLEIGDPLRPMLQPMVGPTVQYEGVTSDARYLNAYIDGSRTYRIAGTRGDAPLIEVGVYTGKQGLFEPSHLIRSLTERDLEVKDGRLEVVFSPNAHPGNWIQTDARARYTMIRQYAADWTGVTEGRFSIEETSAVGKDTPPTVERMADGLEAASRFATRASQFWGGLSDYWADLCLNRFIAEQDADERTDVAAPSGHQFTCGYFRVQPDEALLIRFNPRSAGLAEFWSLSLANYWYETVGYGAPESHLNSGRAVYEADGSVHVVLSHRSNGLPNWIDTKGHCEGTMVFRWSRSESPAPPIECRLVKLDDIGEEG